MSFVLVWFARSVVNCWLRYSILSEKIALMNHFDFFLPNTEGVGLQV